MSDETTHDRPRDARTHIRRHAFGRRRPREVLWDFGYWIWQERSIAILLLLMLGSAVLAVWSGVAPIAGVRDLLEWRFDTPDAMSFIIQASILIVGLVGLAVAMGLISRCAVEQGFAELVADNSARYVLDAEAQPKSDLSPANLETLLPDNPTTSLVAVRMFDRLRRHAQSGEIPSIEGVLAFYQEELLSDVERIRAIQRVALHLGILGTFVGLSFGMPHLQALGGGNAADGAALSGFFGSLRSSFSTSIAGLVMSLLIGRVAAKVEDRQVSMFQRLEEGAESFAAAAQLATRSLLRPSTFDQLRLAYTQLGTDLRRQAERTAEQTDAIERGMMSVHTAARDLDSFLAEVAKLRERVLAELATIGDRLSPKRLVDDVAGGFEQMSVRVAEKIEGGVSRAIEPLGAAASGMQECSRDLLAAREALDSARQLLVSQQWSFNEVVSKGNDRQGDLVERSLAGQLKLAGEISTLFRDQMAELAKVVDTGTAKSAQSIDSMVAALGTATDREHRLSQSIEQLRLQTVMLQRAIEKFTGPLLPPQPQKRWWDKLRRRPKSG